MATLAMWYQRMSRCGSAVAVTYPDDIPNPWLWKSLLLTHSRSRSIYPLNVATHFPVCTKAAWGAESISHENEFHALASTAMQRMRQEARWTPPQDIPFYLDWNILKDIETCDPVLSTWTHVWSASMNVNNHCVAEHFVWLQFITLRWKNDTVYRWNNHNKKINLVVSLGRSTI